MDPKCKQWVQRPTPGRRCLGRLTTVPPMPPGNAHSGGRRLLHPLHRFDSVTRLLLIVQHFRQHRATEAASVPAYPTSVQSPPCQHPPRNPGTLKHQECCRMKTQNMSLAVASYSTLLTTTINTNYLIKHERYRASQPRIASARAAHLSEKLGHSTGDFL